ncbi:MAG: hypothetical protein MOGMAGMI_00348 [Candidatus Omnitrophica bacterium]|nr:hypothetical protein [Candidatus Omnitrophota bacterium]
MSTLQVLNSYIVVEEPQKVKKAQGLLTIPDQVDCTGIVKFLGSEYKGDLKVGDSVFYGDVRFKIRVEGRELLVMEESNIFAKILNKEE